MYKQTPGALQNYKQLVIKRDAEITELSESQDCLQQELMQSNAEANLLLTEIEHLKRAVADRVRERDALADKIRAMEEHTAALTSTQTGRKQCS